MEHQGRAAGDQGRAEASITEKLRGGHDDHQQAGGDRAAQQGRDGVTGTGTGTGEKKGVVENIKEKLPGGHGDPQHTTPARRRASYATTATTDGHHWNDRLEGTDSTGENKSMMDKIKDKLPGQH
uniref:Group2 late embryogenesis abundant protein n=1 Tax=Triticum urartu TaxID=4572 RepID=V5YTL3_TRIUA|nr:LEA protein [Triticum urartu]BAO20286.1 group2 late embryogenesis abundant protein [Triticum urartu]